MHPKSLGVWLLQGRHLKDTNWINIINLLRRLLKKTTWFVRIRFLWTYVDGVWCLSRYLQSVESNHMNLLSHNRQNLHLNSGFQRRIIGFSWCLLHVPTMFQLETKNWLSLTLYCQYAITIPSEVFFPTVKPSKLCAILTVCEYFR